MLDKVKQAMREMIVSIEDEEILSFYDALPFGKMLRSKLILNIAPFHEESIKLCALVELIHLASLLHDDVIDEAKQRRNKASFNALYGDKNAIMLGDTLYAKAFYELSFMDKQIAKNISQAVFKLSIGEMKDVALAEEFNFNEEKYLEMIYLKTAVLIEKLCFSAALLSGKNAKQLGKYGKNLGLAFQIVDDLLDITQDTNTLGKPAMADFKEGKCTLPYIYLYHALNSNDKKILASYFKKELNQNEQAWIKDQLISHNCIQKAFKFAHELGEEAFKAAKGEDKLQELVSSMIDRSF